MMIQHHVKSSLWRENRIITLRDQDASSFQFVLFSSEEYELMQRAFSSDLSRENRTVIGFEKDTGHLLSINLMTNQLSLTDHKTLKLIRHFHTPLVWVLDVIPRFHDLIHMLKLALNEKISIEEVADWAHEWNERDELEELSLYREYDKVFREWIIFLGGADLQVAPNEYFHEREEWVNWIEELEKLAHRWGEDK